MINKAFNIMTQINSLLDRTDCANCPIKNTCYYIDERTNNTLCYITFLILNELDSRSIGDDNNEQ